MKNLFVPVIALAAMFAAIAPAAAQVVNAPNGHRTLAVSPLVAAKGTLLFTYSPIFGTATISQGVAGITNPATGIFCVTPKVKISAKAEPVVTIEWGASLGNALLAFWEQYSYDCNPTDIEVRTFDSNAGGAPVASQEVAFNIFVE